MVKNILKLLRIRHYIKNLLIFFPMFFGGAFFDINTWENAVLGFVAFCAASSMLYVINDIADAESDRLHPTKKNRPIASGVVSKKAARLAWAICLAVVVAISLTPQITIPAAILLAAYIIMNIFYSHGLKRIPIVDVVILAAGYVIRVYFGGLITGVEVSDWLFLVISTGALYMGFGKRRGELLRGTDTREVLKSYSKEFLDHAMTLMMGLTVVFYALWSRDFKNRYMIFTVPLFIVIMLRYGMVSDKRSDGDPVEVILCDRTLILLLVVYGLIVAGMLYAGAAI